MLRAHLPAAVGRAPRHRRYAACPGFSSAPRAVTLPIVILERNTLRRAARDQATIGQRDRRPQPENIPAEAYCFVLRSCRHVDVLEPSDHGAPSLRLPRRGLATLARSARPLTTGAYLAGTTKAFPVSTSKM